MTNKIYKISLYIPVLILLFSCGEKDAQQPNKPDIPEALQEDKSIYDSYERSGGNLVEAMYQELVEKTPALQNLEITIRELEKKKNSVKEEPLNYEKKSDNYYSSATSNAGSISDSIFRNKIIEEVNKSQNAFTDLYKPLKQLIDLLNTQNSSIEDKHLALKILVTLPIIEKYQRDQLPSNKSVNEVIDLQKRLLLRIDSMTTSTRK